MSTALLIINYNDAPTTIELLERTKDYISLDYIVVVDNNSNDDSFKTLSSKYKNTKIEIIKTIKNGGYGYAINFGSKYLVDKYGDLNVIVSNSDIIIYKDEDIKKLISYKTGEDAIVAPYIKEHQGISRGWKFPSPLCDALLNIIYIHRFIKPKLLYYPSDYYDGNEYVYVDTVLGCFFLIDSKILRELNYFDENVFLYGEENIIGKKIFEHNYKVKVVTNVQVFHNHSVSIDKSINKINKYKMLKNSQYYFQKNYNNANFIEKGLYKLTAFLTFVILKIYYGVCK